MKRIVVRSMIACLLLAAILVAAVGLLLGTDSGTAAVLRLVQSLLPGVIELEGSRGNLLQRLHIDQPQVDWGSGKLQADELVFGWSPAGLLQLRLVVNELSATGLRYDAVPPADEPPPEPLQWPIELPAFSTPVPIILKRAAIDGIVISTSPEAAPLRFDSASLVGRWASNGFEVKQFEASASAYTIAISGHFDPMDAYALELDNRVQLRLEDGLAVVLKGSIQGDTEGLELAQRLSGDADLQLQASLGQPLSDPHWNASLKVASLPGELLSEDLPLQISGELTSHGSRSSAVVSGQLESASEMPEYHRLQLLLELAARPGKGWLEFREFELSQQDRPLRLSIAGKIATDQVFDMSGEWQHLQWPLAGAAIAQSRVGQFTLQGEADDFQLDANAELAGRDIPQGQWQLLSRGNREQLDIASLSGRVLGGELEIAGRLGWEPELNWQLQASASKIDPEPVLAGLEGLVDFALSTDGSVGDEGLRARVELQQLGGELNNQPLAGSGKLAYAGDHSSIDRLDISLGNAALRADGVIGQQSNLQWTLDIPMLAKLHADARGRVSSAGRVTGPQQQPQLAGTISAADLAYQHYAIGKLDAKLELDLQDQQRSSISVMGADIDIADNSVQRVELALDGFIRDHSVALSAAPVQAGIEIQARGAYKDATWSGTLEQLALAAQSLGDWQLQQAVDLALGSTGARAEPFCLVRDSSRLCAEGEWRAEGASRAAFQLTELPLNWLKSWLPEELKSVSGELSAKGDIKRGASLRAVVDATITPGELLVASEGEDLSVDHNGAELKFATRGEGAEGSLVAGIGSSRLEADMRLPDLLRVSDPLLARVDGQLRLDAPDLAVLPLLVPALTRVDGTVDADFELGGRLGQPQLDGDGRLVVSRLEVEQIGLQLDDTRLDVGVANDKLTLAGSAVSGGTLSLDGELQLDAGQGWPLLLRLEGEDFRAANLPNLQVLISPDLQLERRAGAFALTGRLVIPRAEILIRDLPAGARSPSPDVVVLRGHGEEKQAGDTAPVATDIVLALGNKVHLSALGFNGFVGGEVNLRANASQPLRATGDVRIDQGTYRVFGQRLEIERGLFSYTNSPIDNPGVNVRAIREIGEVLVGVNALGTARRITVTTFSSPSMSENDRISYLLTGKPANQGASVSLERQIAQNLSVGVNVDTQTGESAFVTRYRILRTLHTEVGSSARGSSLDLFYTIERK